MTKLEILVYGELEEKGLIDLQLRELQKQMDKIDSADIEAAFFINEKKEKTKEECQQFLVNDCRAKYYCFVDASTILEHNFIVKRYIATVTGKSLEKLKQLGVYMKPPSLKDTHAQAIEKATNQN